MSQKVKIEYFGMQGEGRTLKEAKADAGRKITKAMEAYYTPRVISSRGAAILIWRDTYGWYTSIIHAPEEVRVGYVSHSTHNDDEADNERGAYGWLAQITWDGQEEWPPCLLEFVRRHDCDASVKRSLMTDFAYWRGFQLAYAACKAKEPEAGDTAWHRFGCEHASEYRVEWTGAAA